MTFIPVTLIVAYVDDPYTILIKQFLGEYPVQQHDHLDLKILLNRDNTIHLETSE